MTDIMVIKPLTCLFEKPGIRVVGRSVLSAVGITFSSSSPLDSLPISSSEVTEICLLLGSRLGGIE